MCEEIEAITGFKQRAAYKWLWDEHKRIKSQNLSLEDLSMLKTTYSEAYTRLTKYLNQQNCYKLDQITVYGQYNPSLQAALRSISETFVLSSFEPDNKVLIFSEESVPKKVYQNMDLEPQEHYLIENKLKSVKDTFDYIESKKIETIVNFKQVDSDTQNSDFQRPNFIKTRNMSNQIR